MSWKKYIFIKKNGVHSEGNEIKKNCKIIQIKSVIKISANKCYILRNVIIVV